MRCWTRWHKARSCRNNNRVCLTQPTQVEKTPLLNSLGDRCAPDAHVKWRRGTLLASWFSWSLLGLLILQTSWASFFCRVCRKDVSVLTCSGYEIKRHFQGRRPSAHNQWLCLKTPGWRVLDFEGNPLLGVELERQRERILLAPFVVRHHEYPLRGNLIPDASGNVDPQLPMLAKVSCLKHAFPLGGNYEVVQEFSEPLARTVSRIKVTVTWSRDDVLISDVWSLVCQVQYLIVDRNILLISCFSSFFWTGCFLAF